MIWAAIDANLDDDDDLEKLSCAAIALHVCGTTYCVRKQTDGRVPTFRLPRLKGGDDPNAVGELVALGWWIDGGDHYIIRDFLVLNRSRSEIDDLREARAQAGRAGGRRSGASRRSKNEADADGISHPISHASHPTSKISHPTSAGADVGGSRARRLRPGSNVPPAIEEVVEYEGALGCSDQTARRFWDYHEARGWILGSTGQPMKNWQAAIRT